jgi:hypothetical protein
MRALIASAPIPSTPIASMHGVYVHARRLTECRSIEHTLWHKVTPIKCTPIKRTLSLRLHLFRPRQSRLHSLCLHLFHLRQLHSTPNCVYAHCPSRHLSRSTTTKHSCPVLSPASPSHLHRCRSCAWRRGSRLDTGRPHYRWQLRRHEVARPARNALLPGRAAVHRRAGARPQRDPDDCADQLLLRFGQ